MEFTVGRIRFRRVGPPWARRWAMDDAVGVCTTQYIEAALDTAVRMPFGPYTMIQVLDDRGEVVYAKLGEEALRGMEAIASA